ncbi:MAG: DUF3253 domain-containing protein [Comamonadaceae bacterium]|nr:MAG: DUF3253 domain-containing protein [Comamonadaceae bacterium]
MTSPLPSDDVIAQTVFALLAARDATASVCPSEVARALTEGGPGWRPLMPEVRRVAAALAAQNRLRVTRGAVEVDALHPGGPVRLRSISRPP